MRTTEQVNVKVPKEMLAEARETWPEVKDMTVGRVLRFALALALTGDTNRAVAATRDARIGTKRNPTTE
jgi:hypothetical protein